MTAIELVPFDAVLCDVDGVIRHYDHAQVANLERDFGLTPGTTTALTRAGNPDPTRCLFIDDRQENTAAAAALGLTAHLYRDLPTLRPLFAADL